MCLEKGKTLMTAFVTSHFWVLYDSRCPNDKNNFFAQKSIEKNIR